MSSPLSTARQICSRCFAARALRSSVAPLPGFFGSSPQQVMDIGVRLRAPLPLAHNLRREAKAAAFIFPIRPFRVRLPSAARLRNLIVHGLERGQTGAEHAARRTDDNGNRCSVEYWGSEDKARKALASLKNSSAARTARAARTGRTRI